MTLDLCWRAEEACLNAWPSDRTVLLQGWLLRASGGPTRRLNSLNPTRGGGSDPRPILAEAAALYASLGLPLIARVPELAKDMDAHLDAARFAPTQAETITLYADFGAEAAISTARVDVSAMPTPAWLAARKALKDAGEDETRLYERTLSLIVGPCLFAACRAEDDAEAPIVSIAYGAISQGLLVLESVATAAPHRGRRFAEQTVAALMRAAQPLGADAACLQVMSENHPAIRLYKRLGFDTELYRYHYRKAGGV